MELTRKEQAEATRKKILLTVDTILCEREYEDIKITDIVKRAGVSVGTFYHYFSKKEDLIKALYTDIIFPQFSATYDTILAKNGLSIQSIKEYMRPMAVLTSSYGVTHTRNIYKWQYSCGPEFFSGEGFSGGSEGVLAKLLTELQKRNIILADIDTTTLAKDIFIIARGILYNWSLTDGSFDILDCFDRVLETFLKGITA